jgi:hypothetical protein
MKNINANHGLQNEPSRRTKSIFGIAKRVCMCALREFEEENSRL